MRSDQRATNFVQMDVLMSASISSSLLISIGMDYPFDDLKSFPEGFVVGRDYDDRMDVAFEPYV